MDENYKLDWQNYKKNDSERCMHCISITVNRVEQSKKKPFRYHISLAHTQIRRSDEFYRYVNFCAALQIHKRVQHNRILLHLGFGNGESCFGAVFVAVSSSSVFILLTCYRSLFYYVVTIHYHLSKMSECRQCMLFACVLLLLFYENG